MSCEAKSNNLVRRLWLVGQKQKYFVFWCTPCHTTLISPIRGQTLFHSLFSLGSIYQPPSLCNSASLWNQEVFKRWTDSAANSLTGYQVPTYDVHWLWHCSTLICSVKVNPKLELSPLQSSESGTVGGGGWVKRSELKPGIWEIQTKRDNFTLNQSNFPVGVTVWNSRSCPKWRLLYTNTSTWKNIFKFNWIWIRSLSSRRVKWIIEILRENSVYGVLLQSFLFRQQGGDQFQQQRAFHLAKEEG